MIHHSKFGTAEDAEFLNFVTPRRYWTTFLPFAAVINFSDFVIHRPVNYTRSRWITLLVALAYHGPYLYLTCKIDMFNGKSETSRRSQVSPLPYGEIDPIQ